MFLTLKTPKFPFDTEYYDGLKRKKIRCKIQHKVKVKLIF